METKTENKICHRRSYNDAIEETISSIPDDCIKCDVLKSIEILDTFKILETEKCKTLTLICSEQSSNKERLIKFACDINETGSLQFLFEILDKIGQSDIANAILKPIFWPIHRPEMPHSKHLQEFYHQLKINIDSNVFFDKWEFLMGMYNDTSNSFDRFGNDVDRLKKATGRFAVITWLLIQHCSRNTQLIREILNGMRNRWPKQVDDTLAMIIYNSKMAIAAIMDEDVESAEKYNHIAKHLSASWKDPLTKAFICHDSRYTNQRIFEYQGSEKHRKAIFDETITGLCFLESDNNGCELFIRQLKRMFFLYVAQYMLDIRNDLACNHSNIRSSNDVTLASNVIKCFERTVEDRRKIDPRRGMIYRVCKAKVCEIEGEFSEAEKLLSEATQMAEEGAHYLNEARNIREFTNRLLLRSENNSLES